MLAANEIFEKQLYKNGNAIEVKPAFFKKLRRPNIITLLTFSPVKGRFYSRENTFSGIRRPDFPAGLPTALDRSKRPGASACNTFGSVMVHGCFVSAISENICSFSKFSAGGLCDWGFYWLFLWNFKEIKHQAFSMAQPNFWGCGAKAHMRLGAVPPVILLDEAVASWHRGKASFIVRSLSIFFRLFPFQKALWAVIRYLERLCPRKWLVLFSLKFQRNNQKNASTMDSAKGKTGEKGCLFTVLWR